MKEKWQKLLKNKQLMEIVRYLGAGVLTTLVSMIVSFGVQFLLAEKPPKELYSGLFSWTVAAIEAATPGQVVIANGVSWVFAVLFAFWINRGMVFQVRGSEGIGKEFGGFVLGRVLGFLLFEQALAWLLALAGMSNILNRLMIQVLVIVFNYVVSKFWVFRKTAGSVREQPEQTSEEPEEASEDSNSEKQP